MLTDKSAPIFDNAPDVIAPPLDAMASRTAPVPTFRWPLAPHPTALVTTNLVTQCALKRAAQTLQRLLDGPLLSRLDNNRAYLPAFSAFLAQRDVHSQSAGRKRRHDRSQPVAAVVCCGVVFGCCLGSLVSYLAVPGVSVAFIVRQIEAVLRPVAASALKTRGVDARVLCAGIASSRVLRAQLAFLTNDRLPSSLHSRNGNPTTVIGMCASIFVTFSILSSTLLGSIDSKQVERDVVWMITRCTLEQSLQVADDIAASAIPVDGWEAAPAFEIAALDAEHRAIQRARCGVAAARAFSKTHGFAPISTFRKMLDWFARAAWPPGELLNERTHIELLQTMSKHVYYLTTTAHVQNTTESFDLVPLAQLNGLAPGSRVDSDASSATTGSSRTVSSDGSSVAVSAADVADLGIEGLFDIKVS